MFDRVLVTVALPVPLFRTFDYFVESKTCVPGTRVLVSFGTKKLIGLVISNPNKSQISVDKIKPVLQVLDDISPIPLATLELITFVARYYHQPIGLVAHLALPKSLKSPAAYAINKRGRVSTTITNAIKRVQQPNFGMTIKEKSPSHAIQLNHEQKEACQQILEASSNKPTLLFGITGSGKTEVYLHIMHALIEQGKQVLLLVPEINLTPQLLSQVAKRLFAHQKSAAISVLHSQLTDKQRLENWLAIKEHQSSVIIGTRLAIFAPFKNLGMIIVDEEHDSSYRQQDNVRYSARDASVWLANHLQIPIILGSATPSLETWLNAQQHKYRLSKLTSRAQVAEMPSIELLLMDQEAHLHGLSESAHQAMSQTISEGRQVLIFINRRGFSPVLYCPSCTWKSECSHCSSYMVLHKINEKFQLQCHHCSSIRFVPKTCPDCGNQDILPMGLGTQRLEEALVEKYPSLRVLRIDADTTSAKGSAAELFESVHDQSVDIIVGTQMISKGHDFTHLGLVIIVNADSSLFSYNFRACEQLFAQLMQVSGRAGRSFAGAKVLVQTMSPEHPVYQALIKHDYELYAQVELQERQIADLPPYTFQAVFRAEAKQLHLAIQFLQSICLMLTPKITSLPVSVSAPMPLQLVRMANKERAYIMFDSRNRKALGQALRILVHILETSVLPSHVKFILDVDPIESLS